MFELIDKENNMSYGVFNDVKNLIKQIKKIFNNDFNFSIFMEALKDENKDLSDINYLIDVCDNWDFVVKVINN